MDASDIIFYIITAMFIVMPFLKKGRRKLEVPVADVADDFQQQGCDEPSEEGNAFVWGGREKATSDAPRYFTYEAPDSEVKQPATETQRVEPVVDVPTVMQRDESAFNVREAIIYQTILEPKFLVRC